MISAQEKSRTLVEEFVSKGRRLTPQRRAVLEVLDSAEGHLDAATVIRLAQQRDASVNRATVYRTIELLKKLRLIDELDLMHLNGEKHYYEARNRHEHIHLACFGCGKIEEFTSPLFDALKQEITKEKRFHMVVARMEVGGRCSTCGMENSGAENN